MHLIYLNNIILIHVYLVAFLGWGLSSSSFNCPVLHTYSSDPGRSLELWHQVLNPVQVSLILTSTTVSSLGPFFIPLPVTSPHTVFLSLPSEAGPAVTAASLPHAAHPEWSRHGASTPALLFCLHEERLPGGIVIPASLLSCRCSLGTVG